MGGGGGKGLLRANDVRGGGNKWGCQRILQLVALLLMFNSDAY